MIVAPSPAPALSTLSANASPLAATIAASAAAAKVDTSLIDAWEDNRRAMQEKILTERIETADKIVRALGPLLGGALSLPGGAGARPLAGALESLSKEVRHIAQDMAKEFRYQDRLASQGRGKVSSSFHDMIDKMEEVVARTSGMLIAVGGNEDHPPGRLPARELADRGARHLLVAQDDMAKISSRLTALRITRLDVSV